MKTLILALSLSTAGLVAPAVAQHDHGAAPAAEAPRAPAERPVGRPAMREWTKQPLLIGRADRGERAGATLTPRNLTAANVTVYASEGPAERLKTDYPVGADGAKISAVTQKVGNYHWVVAREEDADAVRIASTAWYFGNPGDSPKDMLSVPKHELEIMPAPLPREHRSYREAEKWRFQVRFNGQPLAGQQVVMETEFGSRTAAVTDSDGYATLVFPRDFKPAPQAEGENSGPRQRGRFVLATEKEANGKRYLTAFNYAYTQDTERNRSLGWGAAFGVLGMVAAAPLLRRRKENEGGDHA
ncbi:MAG: DUF4198 domain-containing protein [Rhodocyclaceae bacterium]|nr:DUF4198 domain-containing protein [Rhodocyclaceae bacterium]